MKAFLKGLLYVLLALSILSSSLLRQKSHLVRAADSSRLYLPLVINSEASWAMAGANPQRTSWTPEEVRGPLYAKWYRPIQPYISPKVQIITAHNNLYISTARGLYVLNANDGSDRWIFPTELPLGHSPTVSGNVVFVGGMDKKLYAINALNGTLLWAFTAGGGWDTNPLVVDGKVFAGNRDGTFYAINAYGPEAGQLAWSFDSGGPIHYSAAYKDGVIYFASNDSYAYALNASNGELIWKSAKLPGAGFHSWWPVVYQGVVIFSGSPNYRSMTPPGEVEWISELDRDYIFPNHLSLPVGTLYGPRLSNGWIDATKVMQYYEQFPHRRTNFILDRSSGREVTYDIDGDRKAEYAPFLWFGTHTGNRYPPVVGSDGILYQANPYGSQPYGFRGEITGWKIGTSQISTPSAANFANDEPIAYAAGGRVIYYNLCCDRAAGGFDVTIPNNGTRDLRREWFYFEYNLESKVPGYSQQYYSNDIDAAYGGQNGVYGIHGDQNPPIPYHGMVFMHRSNAVIAFSPYQSGATKQPLATTNLVSNGPQTVDRGNLSAKLTEEVTQIINSGHLRPAYGISGNFDQQGRKDCGDNLMDYYANPSDTIFTLLMTLPYLPESVRQQARTYIQTEFRAFSPFQYVHIEWQAGAPREPYIMPLEIDQGRAVFPAREWTIFVPWTTDPPYNRYPPFLFYTLWKYAQEFGGASTLFNASKGRLTAPPDNSTLAQFPFVHNAYIAGYIGYLNLEKMATGSETKSVRDELNRLLSLRNSTFTKNSPFGEGNYCKTTNVARNFMYMTPELGDFLSGNNAAKAAIAEYNNIAPYWFVTKYEATYGEGVHQPIYDYEALFKARALILKEPAGELIKYLDEPAFPVGDLFYIQNLVYTLAAR